MMVAKNCLSEPGKDDIEDVKINISPQKYFLMSTE